MYLIKWVVAKLFGGKLIYLKDCDGDVTLSIAYRDPWGDMVAKRMWPTSIRVCTLYPDGTVDRGQSYVKFWKYA